MNFRRWLFPRLSIAILIPAFSFAGSLQNKRSKMEYGVAFGSSQTQPGEIFEFEDFNLKFKGLRELTLEESHQKQEAIAKGTDGGASMLGPRNRFSILEKSKPEVEFEIGQMPFHKHRFKAQSHEFELRNSPTKDGRWVLHQAVPKK
jgi:hypothetical protein